MVKLTWQLFCRKIAIQLEEFASLLEMTNHKLVNTLLWWMAIDAFLSAKMHEMPFYILSNQNWAGRIENRRTTRSNNSSYQPYHSGRCWWRYQGRINNGLRGHMRHIIFRISSIYTQNYIVYMLKSNGVFREYVILESVKCVKNWWKVWTERK